MDVELITRDDLEQFKKELLEEIRQLVVYPQRAGDASKTWLKSLEVRKLLGISSGTLQNLRLNGTLPYNKIGGLIYYKYDDIIKLMDSKTDGK